MSYKWNRQYQEASPAERAEMDENYGDYIRDQEKDHRAELEFAKKQRKKANQNEKGQFV